MEKDNSDGSTVTRITDEERDLKIKLLEELVSSLREENGQLKQTIAESRKVFGKQFREFERMKKAMAKLQVEEEVLLGEVEGKKKALCVTSRENARKEELIRKLKGKLARRQSPVAPAIVSPIIPDGRTMKPELEEGRDAAKIFPEEIWEMILGNVKDPQDLWNCYNSCPLFRKILHQWSTGWLFEQALPYLFPYLPGEKLLECRTVSKNWKGKVDQFLQDHPSLRPHDEETCNPRTLSFVSPEYEKGFFDSTLIVFCDDDDGMLPNYENLENLNQIRGRLLVGREARMLIYSNDEEEREDDDHRGNEVNELVWENVFTFLRTYGELVWYLELEVKTAENNDWAKQKVYKFLKEDLIELAPNLRRLRLGKEMPSLVREYAANLDWTRSYPFLETLEIDADCPINYFSDFLRSFARMHHAQLKKLNLEKWTWTNLPRLDWPNLTELDLSTVEHQIGFVSINSLESLLRTAVPNLSKLVLETSSERYLLSSYFRRFLEILGELSRTTRLRTLRLVLRWAIHNNVLQDPQPFPNPEQLYDLPKLTTLELEIRAWRTAPHPNLEFLLYFPCLENLHVFWSKSWCDGGTALHRKDELDHSGLDQYPREVEVVEVNKFLYTGEMYKSNIWELLPRLKVFTFQWEVYTRGEYEEYRRKKGESESVLL